MKTTLKTGHRISRDKNGNRVLRIRPPRGRGFSIQTNHNLPGTHRDGVTARTKEEVLAHVTKYGTDTQRAALGLPARYAPRHFIQRRGNGYLETVDEFPTWKEARAMLAEYLMCDPSAAFYISSRPCKNWRD